MYNKNITIYFSALLILILIKIFCTSDHNFIIFIFLNVKCEIFNKILIILIEDLEPVTLNNK